MKEKFIRFEWKDSNENYKAYLIKREDIETIFFEKNADCKESTLSIRTPKETYNLIGNGARGMNELIALFIRLSEQLKVINVEG